MQQEFGWLVLECGDKAPSDTTIYRWFYKYKFNRTCSDISWSLSSNCHCTTKCLCSAWNDCLRSSRNYAQ